MRVLVAEDDVRLAEVLEQSLAEAGWAVEVVHDGRHATVSFRGESAEVGVPTELPPWLDPAYLEAGERAAHRW